MAACEGGQVAEERGSRRERRERTVERHSQSERMGKTLSGRGKVL